MRIKKKICFLFFVLTTIEREALSNNDQNFIKQYVKSLQHQAILVTKQDISDLVRDLFVQGVVEMSIQNYENAYDLFSQALRIDPTNSCLHFKIAQILTKFPNLEFKRRFITDKKTHIYAAIELNSSIKNYYYFAIDMHKSCGEYEEAIVAYERLIKNFSSSNDDLWDLASLYVKIKDFKEALKVYSIIEQQIGVNKNIVSAKHKAFISLNEVEMAISEQLKLVSHYPENENYVLDLITLLINNDQEDFAIRTLKSHVTSFPNNLQAYEMLLKLLIKNYRIEESMFYLRSFIIDININYESKLEILDSFINSFKKNPGFVSFMEDIIDSLIIQYPCIEVLNLCIEICNSSEMYAKIKDLEDKLKKNPQLSV